MSHLDFQLDGSWAVRHCLASLCRYVHQLGIQSFKQDFRLGLVYGGLLSAPGLAEGRLRWVLCIFLIFFCSVDLQKNGGCIFGRLKYVSLPAMGCAECRFKLRCVCIVCNFPAVEVCVIGRKLFILLAGAC